MNQENKVLSVAQKVNRLIDALPDDVAAWRLDRRGRLSWQFLQGDIPCEVTLCRGGGLLIGKVVGTDFLTAQQIRQLSVMHGRLSSDIYATKVARQKRIRDEEKTGRLVRFADALDNTLFAAEQD